MKFGLFILLLWSSIVVGSCTSEGLKYSDEDSRFLGFVLFLKSNNGNLLDQSPQAQPYPTNLRDTLKLQAEIYEFDSADTTYLKNLWYKKVKRLRWESPDGRTGEQNILYYPDTTLQEQIYRFFLIDLNGDTLRDSLRIQPLQNL